MFKKVTTLTEFIIAEERKFKDATGSFTLLMTQIENATKIIASHVKESGLIDILGHTGEKNAFQEEVQKLDEFSNTLLVDTLQNSGQVNLIGSEELPDVIQVEKHPGHYDVFFDPLDGSSNIDVNISIGTIFAIYKKGDKKLQIGRKQIAAGYTVYGPSVMFIYTSGNGVNGFTLDPAIGAFLLSHPDIKIPEKGDIYSLNEGYYNRYDPGLQHYLQAIKKGDKPYRHRYAGAMVADVHRTLLKGGIFIYPNDSKTPNGKLRLTFEVNPMSFIMEQAGGMATSNGKNPLEIEPESMTHTVPIALGSKQEVEKFLSFITN